VKYVADTRLDSDVFQGSFIESPALLPDTPPTEEKLPATLFSY